MTDMTGFQTPYDPMAAFKVQSSPYWNPQSMGQTSDPTIAGISTDALASVRNTPATAGGGGMFGGFLDTFNPDGTKAGQGWGSPALGAASGIFNAYMGMKQYGLAKDQLAEGKRQFALNYDAQRTTTNSQLQDRQAARVASNPTAYQSVGDYMTANSIKPATGG